MTVKIVLLGFGTAASEILKGKMRKINQSAHLISLLLLGHDEDEKITVLQQGMTLIVTTYLLFYQRY